MIKHRSITLRILDALAKTAHRGMTYPQIVALTWRLSHPRGPKYNPKSERCRKWWNSNLRGAVENHIGLLNTFAWKVTLHGKTRWHRNDRPATAHPWRVVRREMPVPSNFTPGPDPRQ